MEKLLLTPDAGGYSSQEGEEVLRTELDGGAGRYRLDKIGASKIVNVQWTMNPAEYQYWRAFFTTVTKKGALPFTCDLVSEDGNGPTEHVCSFIPTSVSLPSQQGLQYVQQAQLEARPLTHDAAADRALIDLFAAYGEGGVALLDKLAKLVNVDLVPGLEDA